MSTTNQDVVDQVRRCFDERGDALYVGEPVTQTEHALQCAAQAEQSGAASTLISAALLHDIGHLLHDLGEDCADEGIDDLHEQRGAAWLEQFFPADVYEPVKLHVSAKRYRCAVDSGYRSRLSEASLQSLRLQGGPMSADEVSQFRNHPWFKQAIQLRGWDEAAKVAGLKTPPLSYFLEHIARSLS